MKLLVIGAGAIGCLVSAKLATAGCAVTLVGRPALAEVVRRQGIVLRQEDGTVTVRTVQVVDRIAAAFAYPADRYDLALLTVKSYDTAAALVELRSVAMDLLPPFVSLQNGIGNEEMLAAALGAARVIAGTVTVPVSVAAPGVIQVEQPSYQIGLSPWGNGVLSDMVDRLAAALTAAGFQPIRFGDPAGMKWTKLLMNMMTNATCAILDENPATVLADPALADLELAAWREALAVMRRAGIQPVNLSKYPFRLLAPLIRTMPKAVIRPIMRGQVTGGRGGKLPSLHIDLSSGKGRSEVSWLNGAVVRKGEELSVPTPVNLALTHTLLALVAGTESRDRWRHNHALLLDMVRNPSR